MVPSLAVSEPDQSAFPTGVALSAIHVGLGQTVSGTRSKPRQAGHTYRCGVRVRSVSVVKEVVGDGLRSPRCAGWIVYDGCAFIGHVNKKIPYRGRLNVCDVLSACDDVEVVIR